MNKIKEILKDIWSNYKFPLVASVLFTLVFIYFKIFDDIETLWFIIGLLLINGVRIATLIYGLIKYFRK